MIEERREPDVARSAEEADRRYNNALTALDRTLAPAVEPSPATVDAGPVTPPLPDGWRGRALRVVHQWLRPFLERQSAFNKGVAAAFEAWAARERERARSAERFQTALILYLQQITAFVESKDRLITSTLAPRLDRHQEAIDAIREMQAQVSVLQRATEMLTREVGLRSLQSPVSSLQSPVSSPQSPVSSPRPGGRLHDYKYVAFEDCFRGSDEQVREKQRAYLPLFAGTSDVLDIGCGRGEFLSLLREEAVPACGVDVNHEMVAVASAKGLEVVESDALTYLESLDDSSLGGMMAAQVVEHLDPEYLVRVLGTACHKLRPGAPIVVETINPACWLAFFSSYIRDLTHVRPIHPDTLQYLLRASGFTRVTIAFSAPVPDHMKMQPVTLPDEIRAATDSSSRALVEAARTVNANAASLNNLLFTYFDYAAIGYRS